MRQGDYLVEMNGVTKRFGRVTAVENVDFNVRHGEVMGLVGDNGAGKSTLIKILTGVHTPDTGQIFFDGQKVRMRSPRDARELGIETVYQDLGLIPLLTITRNFFLGREIVKKVGPLQLMRHKEMDEIAAKAMRDIGVRVRNPHEPVAILSGGERQSVSIGRAMYFGAKLLILDEPTAALSIKESQHVLDYVCWAREHGISVVFITHNIYHVYSVADRFTILENSRKVAELDKGQVNAEGIIDIIRRGYAESSHCNRTEDAGGNGSSGDDGAQSAGGG